VALTVRRKLTSCNYYTYATCTIYIYMCVCTITRGGVNVSDHSSARAKKLVTDVRRKEIPESEKRNG